jgi:hypothetical protein
MKRPTETKYPATWNRVLLENRTVLRLVKKFPTRRNPKMYYLLHIFIITSLFDNDISAEHFNIKLNEVRGMTQNIL